MRFTIGLCTVIALVGSASLADARPPDTIGPTITATVVPHADMNGWHHTPVTFSFQCEDDESGVQTCPAPVTFATQGANQTSTVQATDAANNPSSLEVTANLDFTPPSIAFAATPPAVTSATSVALTMTVSDALSGLQAVSCDSVTADIASNTATCTVSLAKGANAVIITALDMAGNATSVSAIVTRTGPSESLRIQPNQLMLLVGDYRPIHVVDDASQPISTGLTWTSSDADVATVDTTDGVVVIANGVGKATLAASDGTLSADLEVNVLAASTDLSAGAVVWTTAPVPDWSFWNIVEAAPDEFGPTILAFASSDDNSAAALYALGPDGSRKWAVSIDGWPQRLVGSPDSGGLLIGMSDVTRLGAPNTGLAWKQLLHGAIARYSAPLVAQGPDGRVVAIVDSPDGYDREIVSLAAATGAVEWTLSLPRSSYRNLHVDCSDTYSIFTEGPAETSAPVIDNAGTTFLFVSVDHSMFDYKPGNDCYTNAASFDNTFHLVSISAAGAATWTLLNSSSASTTGPAGNLTWPTTTGATGRTLAPLPGRGVLAVYVETVSSSTSSTHTTIFRKQGTASDSSFSTGTQADVRDVFVGEGSTAYLSFYDDNGTPSTLIVDTTAGTSTTLTNTWPMMALADGNLLSVTDWAWETRDASGTVIGSAIAPYGDSRHISGRLWAAIDSGVVVGQFATDIVLADSPFPLTGGLGLVLAAKPPTLRNFSSSPVLAKFERCTRGFEEIAGASGGEPRFVYRDTFDGVKPPGWTGNSSPDWTGDWYKVNDGARIRIGTLGEPSSESSLPWTLLACWDDFPADSSLSYLRCGGRKKEPEWSTVAMPTMPDGQGRIDWHWPRPIPFDCGAEPWWKIW